MARQKIKSEPIGGFTYEVTQLGAVEGKKLYVQVAKIVLPAMGAALKGRDIKSITKDDLAGFAWDEVAKALVTSLDGIDPIIDSMMRSTDVYGEGFGPEGAPLARNFDDHFAARPMAMLQWLVFAVKANLADFFDGEMGGASLFAGLVAKA